MVKGAFCFVELSYLVPKSGSIYTYLQEGFGKTYKLGRLPGFMYAWFSTIAIIPGYVTVVSLTSSEYLCKTIWTDEKPSQVVINSFAATIIGHFIFHNICIIFDFI